MNYQMLKIISFLLFPLTSALIFTGGQNQYARFKLWDTAGLKSVLTFKFKAKNPSGLIFYFDDGGINDGFMVLQLKKGKLQLRYKVSKTEQQQTLLASNDQPFTSQLDSSQSFSTFADNNWHQVVVQRDHGKVRMAVDKGLHPSRKDWIEFISIGSNGVDLKSATSLYFGGIPKSFKITDLSLPAVYWLQPFQGEISDVMMDFVSQEVTQSEDILESPKLLCANENPCENNGVCKIKNSKVECECGKQFYGQFCEKRKFKNDIFRKILRMRFYRLEIQTKLYD